ncbi:MAG: thiamine pyrophosphate-dependent enzyme [Methanoregula sp.]|jgi:2-oxoglutarate ferredoxin oxidoreductase subunit beta
MTRNLITGAQNTWCPGCGNFTIQHTLKNILSDLEKAGTSLDDVVLVSGIGCHAKIADYFNINSVYTLHGRTLPVATGLKLANPKLTVICCAGDGDAYAEGLAHLIFAAKRNIDITLIVHNNRVYGLTTGQYTPTSPLGFKGKSTPAGTTEYPFNPLELMLASGATYIARGYTRKMDQLAGLIRGGIAHRGFAFIDTLQICASFFNMTEYYGTRVYEIEGHNPSDFTKACEKAREWDYNRDAPIALGLFYEKSLPVFDDRIPARPQAPEERDQLIRGIFEAAQ